MTYDGAMVSRDEITRVIAICEDCGSTYVAQQWPDGKMKLIGTETCLCGSSDFTIVKEADLDISEPE